MLNILPNLCRGDTRIHPINIDFATSIVNKSLLVLFQWEWVKYSRFTVTCITFIKCNEFNTKRKCKLTITVIVINCSK